MSNTKLWAITLLGAALGWMLYLSAPALKPVLMAIVLAYLLNPAVKLVQKKTKLGQGLAIALVLSSIFVLLVVAINSILPPIITQATAFVKEFQTYSTTFEEIVDQLKTFMLNKGASPKIMDDLDKALGQLYSIMTNFLLSFLSSALTYIFRVVDALIIGVLVCYFLASGRKMLEFLITHAPGLFQKPMRDLLKETDHVIWSYIKTQLVIALIIGAVSTGIFMLVGLKFSILLGIICGVLNLIPYFGSIIGGALAVLVALLTSGINQAVMVGLGVLVIQQLEGNVITPRLQAKSSGMHPVVIIAALLICNYLWGTMGMFVAVPLAGVTKIVIEQCLRIIEAIE